MLSEDPENRSNGEVAASSADEKTLPSEEIGAPDKCSDNYNDHEDDAENSAADGDETSVINRRKFFRSEFTYPVEFRLFSRGADNVYFKGYLKDISVSGACLQYDDTYGRFNLEEMRNAKIKLSLSIPNSDKVIVFALIRWVKRIDIRSFSFKMGIEFQDLERWQLDVIEKLIGMRNKDHNMMWNLWEQYNSNLG
ncbi:MAG: PilZ domain-containing protein [Nitrospiraceae bacterium]|nr:MAG: PilZ domain-containing protein [Nitrospiraceae bacterium]